MGVEAVVVPRPLAVEALTVTSCELRVTNTGPADDEYAFAIDRESAQWGWVTPPTIAVAAGGQGSVKVMWRLPKAPKPPAGPLPFTITVTSVKDRSVATVAEGVVEVVPFSDTLATLNPVSAQGSGPSHHTLALSNRGNAPVSARLTLVDPTGALDIDVEPVTLEPGPGTSVTANLRVSPRHRLRRGTAERPFEVVGEVEGGAPFRVDGMLIQEGTGSRRAPVIAAVVVAVLAVGVAVALAAGGKDSPDGRRATEAAATAPVDDPACPARGHDNRDRGSTGALPFNYSFLFVTPDGCKPIRFNPCEPIHYVVNPTDAPPGGVDDVRQAFRMIAEAGGYTFVDDGFTDADRFDFGRQAYNPARYGERWAPIVVSWSHLGSQGRNDVIVAGMGDGQVVDGVIVTGMLNLNADARTDASRETPVPSGFGEGISWGRVMLHELGHVFGLGHVQSKNSIMHEALLEQTLSRTEYGVGDIQAWRQLGRQAGCIQTPPP
ncbi:MAG: M10 family metallopeptidase domain-containing protein, partial [Actinomycetota bacterium]|nr:M10 family metallopeptidase domain-containing protein [Actinomycetota bacterium]